MWPSHPTSTDPINKFDIPHSPATEETLRGMDDVTVRGLFSIMNTYHDNLEAVTGGDEQKEQLMGDMIIRVAVASANRRERELRGMPL